MPQPPKLKPCPRCNGTKKFNKKACALCKGTGGVAERQVFTSVTHIAERAIDINGRVIQRCVWCGFKLIDQLVKDQPLDGRSKPKPICTWAPGDLVRLPIDVPQDKVNQGVQAQMVGHMQSDLLPADFCNEMVEQA